MKVKERSAAEEHDYVEDSRAELSRAEPETIDRRCLIQINIIFGSKKIYFLLYDLYFLFFSEPSECLNAV
jgi:hypothetical protein